MILNYIGYSENIRIYNYLAKIFSEKIMDWNSSKYKLTAVVANKIIRGEALDVLQYPNIAMNANTDNVALKPEFVDNCLELKRIELLLKSRYCLNCNEELNIFKFSKYHNYLKISELRALWLDNNFKIFCDRLCQRKYYKIKGVSPTRIEEKNKK